MSQPSTSRIANENASGFKADHCQRILAAIRRFPGSTAGEIANVIGLQKVAVSRRLPELEKSDDIYRDAARMCLCPNCQSRQLTWWLKPQKPKQGNLFDASPHKKW